MAKRLKERIVVILKQCKFVLYLSEIKGEIINMLY